MTTNAPAAISQSWALFKAHEPRAQLGGIVGDAAHGRSGYHISRADCYSGDYSVVLADDKLGTATNASALDITLPADLMKKYSARLMALCKANDPRMNALREWFGTVNGSTVTGWDRHGRTNYGDDTYTSSDDSHLWHIHLSFYRRYSNDAAAQAQVILAMLGEEGDDVTPQDKSDIINGVWHTQITNPVTGKVALAYQYLQQLNKTTYGNELAIDALAKTLTGLVEALAAVKSELDEIKAGGTGAVSVHQTIPATLTIGGAA